MRLCIGAAYFNHDVLLLIIFNTDSIAASLFVSRLKVNARVFAIASQPFFFLINENGGKQGRATIDRIDLIAQKLYAIRG